MNRLRTTTFALAFALIGAAGVDATAATRPCRDVPAAFEDVSIVRPETGRVLPHQTVLVGCGVISAVGPSRQVRAPRTGRVLGRGGYLSPGLVDAHVHLRSDTSDLSVMLAAGITTVRNMDGSPTALQWRDSVRNGALAGPNIYSAGPILHGDEAQWKGRSEIDAAREIVREERAAGYDYVKVYYQLTPTQYDALIRAAKQAGLAVVGHVPRSITLAHALAEGQWSIEHLTGFDDALEPADRHVPGRGSAWLSVRRFAVADPGKMRALAQEVARSRAWNIPTLLTYEVWTRPEEIRADMADPAVQSLLSKTTKEGWSSFNPFTISPLDQQTPEQRQSLALAAKARRDIVKALYDAGAPMAIGTDQPDEKYMVPGRALHEELAIFEAIGIPRSDVLTMATVNGAKALGHGGEFGRIAVGQRADLLLLSANPLDDLSRLQNPEGVMANGRWFDRAQLDALVAGVRAQHQAPG